MRAPSAMSRIFGFSSTPETTDDPVQTQTTNVVMSDHESVSNATVSDDKPKYTAEELEEYRQVFALFDKDGSGAIGTDELGEAMQSMGMDATEKELEQLIKEIDADGNGEIDFEEFCDCMKKMTAKKQTDEEVIRDCFEVFDQDNNGVVSEAEFKHVLREIGNFPESFIDEFFHEVDVAGNGHIEYDEFSMMVRNYLLDDDSGGGS